MRDVAGGHRNEKALTGAVVPSQWLLQKIGEQIAREVPVPDTIPRRLEELLRELETRALPPPYSAAIEH